LCHFSFLLLTKSISVLRRRLESRGLLATLLACCGALDNSQNFVFTHDQKLFVINLDFRAAVFPKEHAIASANVERLTGAVVAVFTFADGYYFTLLGFLFRGIGNNNSPAHLLALFDAAQNYAIMKGSDVDCHTNKMLLSVSCLGTAALACHHIFDYSIWHSRKMSAKKYSEVSISLSNRRCGVRKDG